mmetsp:Transcript_20655/g.38639  ORF Transcript_20655/g.38639 Transcript_20655/m.38639 type:complete len:310 (+) Transcript_20655:81-1010(+)
MNTSYSSFSMLEMPGFTCNELGLVDNIDIDCSEQDYKTLSDFGERGCVEVSTDCTRTTERTGNYNCDGISAEMKFDLEPTPIASHGIHIVDRLPLSGNHAVTTADCITHNDGILEDWIQLLRENGGTISKQDIITQDPTSHVVDSHKSEQEQAKDFQIHSHQSEKWYGRYLELCEFHRKHGHSVVPYNYKELPALAWWVKRQRNQYKRKQEGQHHTLTVERQQMLEALDFVWDAHSVMWETKFRELIEFRETRGHTNVSNYDDPKLVVWTKCQRRQYRLFRAGEKSSMTSTRIQKLNAIGFHWDPSGAR